MLKLLLLLCCVLVSCIGCSPSDPLEDLYTTNVYPASDATYTIGSEELAYLNAYINNIYAASGVSIDSLTPLRLVASDANKSLVSTDLYNWVSSTVNNINIADDGDGTITLTLPQPVGPGNRPTFAGTDFTANVVFDDSVGIYTDTGDTDYFTLSAYDIDNPSYKDLIQVVNGADPYINFGLGDFVLFDSGNAVITDTVNWRFGSDWDYWFIYNATSTRFEFWSNDCDGGGSDGLIYYIDDDTDGITFCNSITAKGFIVDAESPLTISSGTINASGCSLAYVETEGGSASDDLDTISNGVSGQFLTLSCYDDTHTVVVKDGTSIALAGDADFTMSDIGDILILMYLDTPGAGGDYWREVSRSNN